MGGVKSQGYRFLAPYKDADLKEHLLSKTTLVNKLKDFYCSHKAKEKYPELLKFLEQITIDQTKAVSTALDLAFNQPLPQKRKKKKASTSKKTVPKKKRSESEIRNDLYASYLSNINNIVKQQWKFDPDDFSGRLHTNITNLKKELRKHLSYKGQKLVAIDLKNSQPYLLLSVLRPFNKIGKLTKETIEEIDPNALKEVKTTMQGILKPSSKGYGERQWGNTIRLVKSNYNSTNGYNDDLRLYKQLVKNGGYYEFLMKAFDTLETKSTPFNRDQVKTQTLTFMYERDATVNRYGIYGSFKTIFPTITKIYAVLKQNNYKNFSKFLQTLEARLFLDTAYKKISIQRPDLPIFTVHDSLVTTVGNEKFVEKVLSEVLKKEVGVKPSLKTEPW